MKYVGTSDKMNWNQFCDMNYMFVFLSNYGDEETTNDEIYEMSTKLLDLTYEKDRDGDGIVDSSLTDDERDAVIEQSWQKYGGLDQDGKASQFFTSARKVAEYFQYSHNKMQAFVNGMVDIASADGYIDGTEEEIINSLADAWGCNGVQISYNAGIPVFLFVW